MNEENLTVLPVIKLQGEIVFPGTVANLESEREDAVLAIEAAMRADRKVFLMMQCDDRTGKSADEQYLPVGIVCLVKQVLKTPGSDSMKAMVEGLYRGEIIQNVNVKGYTACIINPLSDDIPENISDTKAEAVLRCAVDAFADYVYVSDEIPSEILATAYKIDDLGVIADFIAGNITHMRFRDSRTLLLIIDPIQRLSVLTSILKREVEVRNIEAKIKRNTQHAISKDQRDYFLREQMRAIRRELGESSSAEDEDDDDLSEYKQKILKLSLPAETEEKLLKELSRMSRLPYGSQEQSLMRNYLDFCIELPWNNFTSDTDNISRARTCLDEDHYGLTKVKERILEYLAVRRLAPDLKANTLCLVGPPGVGKTSIAMSIARAMNRKLARVSLGGVHDEADIRGHRKTYVGAMPGRIITAISQAKTMNPVIVLDEIDKLGSDYRGDPSSALLEALDSAQNSTFRDHYLEVPFDLSRVLFITTANTTESIPRALLDRMEVIEIPSYTDEEKLQIAKKYLFPRQRKENGLNGHNMRISDDAIKCLISDYTRESGVRQLERRLGALCRKAALEIVQGEKKSVSVKSENLEPMLGPAKYHKDEFNDENQVGLVHGLAWTSVGGEVLDVEAVALEGTGKLELTGNLGDVMKESAQAAVAYVRSRSNRFGIAPDFYKTKDLHVHFPEGAVPKDGPSAGVTVCTAVISALTGIPVRGDIAMTGEISLRGKVMPIGGLREKTMAALRNHLTTVIIPKENTRDLSEIDPLVREQLNFVSAGQLDDVIEAALSRMPEPLSGQSGQSGQ